LLNKNENGNEKTFVVFDLCNVFNTDQNTVQSIYNQLNGPDIIIKMVKKKTAYFLPKITYSYNYKDSHNGGTEGWI